MSLFAKAVDVLQGEASVQMGCLVPTITLLKTKLQHLRLSSKFCRPLVDALQAGLDSGRCDDNILKLGLDFIKGHLKEQPMVHLSDTSHSSEEDDFVSPIKQGNAQENSKQLESYLACPLIPWMS
ncbi:uncharacterized protein LOC126402589 [Scomber scombrus]|uniref:Uncharacterized protein LOC126402589 n=1 Tax=Scomber scombrus TaxID=13677 RepID=A0AAV1PT64_SCOSC